LVFAPVLHEPVARHAQVKLHHMVGHFAIPGALGNHQIAVVVQALH
jgi:hypothetical protein